MMPLLKRGLLSLIILAIAGTTFGVWRAHTGATGTTMMALSPAAQVQLYDNATPFAVTLNLTNATNIGAYQFRLIWNPNKLQWVSSSLPDTTWLASTGRSPQCFINYLQPPEPTDTATSTGTPPPPATATNTPASPSATPQPYQDILFSCSTQGTPGQYGLPAGPSVGDTPVALASFQFNSIATVETSDTVQLMARARARARRRLPSASSARQPATGSGVSSARRSSVCRWWASAR